MKTIETRFCPVCNSRLHINRLACPSCKAEYPIDEELSSFDYLSDKQKELLEAFLRYKGNLKLVGEELDMSYPTVNKRYEELLIALGLKEKKAITLITLVITIVILIVLAGVLIRLTLGNNGLIRRIKEAVILQNKARYFEELESDILSINIEKQFDEQIRKWMN